MNEGHRVGVIDIGSNTVRLVIFETWRTSILPRFNEKVMAGLGTGLAETGMLSQGGWHAALKSLRRYRAILDGLGVTSLNVVATAAVRVARDGREFVAAAETAIGAPVRVLSGQDEGRISAEGVLAGMHRPRGIVADLGGSSLELYGVDAGGGANGAAGPDEDEDGETHMLGPLAIDALLHAPERDIRKHVRSVLKGSALLKQKTDRIYAVGGAWRALAKVDMYRSDYPIGVLHGYEMSAKSVATTTSMILEARTAEPGLDALGQKVAGRRAAKLPLSATVLDEVLRACGAKRVVVSSMGLREGVVREQMGVKEGDMLFEGTAAFLRLDGRQVAFGKALYAFLSHVFDVETPCFGSRTNDARLYRTACLLSDSAGRFHPDHRADMAYDQALRAPYAGVNHPERAFLALAAGLRYRRRFSAPKGHRILLDDQAIQRARQLGLMMRLGAVFSGRSGAILARGTLGRTDTELTLIVDQADADMVSETVIDRHSQAAKELGLTPKIISR